jgi:hypothetical protein
MTTRAERQQERIARLLDQAQAAAETWARAEYDAGVQDGRFGAGPTRAETRRATAERRYRDVMARLSAAISQYYSRENKPGASY